jgi:hypothetical protein
MGASRTSGRERATARRVVGLAIVTRPAIDLPVHLTPSPFAGLASCASKLVLSNADPITRAYLRRFVGAAKGVERGGGHIGGKLRPLVVDTEPALLCRKRI